MSKYFRIGELARLYHISTDSLRYYEELGLLIPKRSSNNYRLYSSEDLWRLNIIRDLRALDFSMESIREYLDKWEILLISSFSFSKSFTENKNIC